MNPSADSMAPHTLMVTGGAGYIGSHMVRQLVRAGHRVVVLDDLSRGNRDAITAAAAHAPERCELVEGSIGDPAALERAFARGIDAVVHFAALAYVGESMQDPARYYRNNTAGTLSLLEAMHAHGVTRLVFSSTCATYGVPDRLPITEDTPQHPINPYGASKLMVERMLADLAGPHGLDSVALRYFNASGCAPDGSIGERHDPETHLLPLVLFEALRLRAGGDPERTTLRVFGDDFATRDGTCVRDYVHVEDLCSAHLLALQNLFATPGSGSRRYNLGTRNGDTVLEVIEACRRVTGIDIRYRVDPRRAGDPPELVADASRVRDELGWQPAYPDVEAAIRHAWDWFCAHPPPSAPNDSPDCADTGPPRT